MLVFAVMSHALVLVTTIASVGSLPQRLVGTTEAITDRRFSRERLHESHASRLASGPGRRGRAERRRAVERGDASAGVI